MTPRMSRRMLAPINSTKHFVPRTRFETVAGTVVEHVIVDSVALASVGATTADVQEGATIKAILVEFWMAPASSTTPTQFTFIIYKLPSGVGGPSLTDMLNLMAWDNKKNILFTSQGVLGLDSAGGTIPLHRSWLKIPKGKQRFGLGDRFAWSFVTVDSTAQACSMNIYKEYT